MPSIASVKRHLASLAYQEQKFELADPPAARTLATIGDLIVRANYLDQPGHEAVFKFWRDGKPIYSLTINDIYNPNGWFTVSPNRMRFALSWSDGGAIGGFHHAHFRTDSIRSDCRADEGHS